MLTAALALTGLLAARPAPAHQAEPVLVERRLAAMGTWLDLRVLAADRAAALAASERAARAIEATEARLSTWRDDSELARLNRAPVGEWFALSEPLASDLRRAGAVCRATEGAFDPGLAALVAAWGLRAGGRRPEPAELDAARAARGLEGLELDGARIRRLHPAAGIEEGGFGKGSGLEAARAALLEAGVVAAVVDLGGQLLVLGDEHEARLADPRDRARAVLALRMAPGSLATSGNSERGIVVDGEARAHLLDPRTGAPAEDFGSLSVWASDALEADCLSTGLYVLGPDDALAWALAHPGCEVVVLRPVADGLRATATPGLRSRLTALVGDLELAFVGEDSDPAGSGSRSPEEPR